MKRLSLFLLCAVLAITIASPTQAKTKKSATAQFTPTPATPVVIHQKDLPQWVQDDAERKLHSRHRTAYVKDITYYGDYTDDGHVVGFPKTALDSVRADNENVDYLCAEGRLPIGTSSRLHYDPIRNRQIMSDLYNGLLGSPRANTVNDSIEVIPDEPYNGTIRNFRPGVVMVHYAFPATVKDMPVTDIREVHHYYHDSTSVFVEAELPKFWLRPSAGVAGSWLDPQRVLTPTGYIAAGTRFGRYAVGGYVGGGQDFQPGNRGTASAGVQFGDEPGASIRAGYRSTWNEFRGDGHTSQRSEGFEAGFGYGFPAVRLGITISMQYYSDLDNRGGDYYPAINLSVDFGPVFLWK